MSISALATMSPGEEGKKIYRLKEEITDAKNIWWQLQIQVTPIQIQIVSG